MPDYDEESAGMRPATSAVYYSECREAPIVCLKGKKEAKDKLGNFQCKNCGAISKKKSRLCKPKKIK